MERTLASKQVTASCGRRSLSRGGVELHEVGSGGRVGVHLFIQEFLVRVLLVRQAAVLVCLLLLQFPSFAFCRSFQQQRCPGVGHPLTVPLLVAEILLLAKALCTQRNTSGIKDTAQVATNMWSIFFSRLGDRNALS